MAEETGGGSLETGGEGPARGGSARAERDVGRSPRPLITPDAYAGETNWDEWVEHFESSALVNGWDDPTKLLWLRARLTGKAQTAWKRLAAEAKMTYAGAKEALRNRFEPDSKRELYSVEFYARKRHPAEPWGDFADNLRVLADRAFPELQDEAREKLSLDRYLGEIGQQQVAFAVRQRRPKTLDDAVSHTLELESYLKQKPATVAGVTEGQLEVAAIRTPEDPVLEALKSLTARMERLEASVSSGKSKEPSDGATRGPIVCRKCGQEGHFARGCAAGRGQPRPGN